MSAVFDDRDAFKDNPYYKLKREYGDFTPFYITITLCTVVAITLFILNIVLGCCSRYSEYWNDRHTGNRFITALWTSTPHQQPPLDLIELEEIEIPQQYQPDQQVTYTVGPSENIEYSQLKKRESDI